MAEYLTLKVVACGSSSVAGDGTVGMDRASRTALGVDIGDAVEISGGRSTVANVGGIDPADEGRGLILMDGLTRSDALALVDDEVKVRRIAPTAASGVILLPDPDGDGAAGAVAMMGAMIRQRLIGRVMSRGMRLTIPDLALKGLPPDFLVAHTDPEGPVVVSSSTRIRMSDAAASWTESVHGGLVTASDLGGLGDELKHLTDAIIASLGHPVAYRRMGVSAPRGILVCGPPGSGKTLLVEAAVNTMGLDVLRVSGARLAGDETGTLIEDLFEEARRRAPCLIFIEDLDRLAPARTGAAGEPVSGLVTVVAEQIDGLRTGDGIAVTGTARNGDSVDPSLRRSGRFDRTIDLGMPGELARREILGVCTAAVPLADDVDLDRLAGKTRGFTGADLAALCREAAVKRILTHIPASDRVGEVPGQGLLRDTVRMEDFESALVSVRPLASAGVSVEIPDITWDDIGGLDGIRDELLDTFVPAEADPPFRRLGIEPCRGVLLYGPPGTGKTMIAKALANTSGAGFIQISGPEIASKWLGDSELAVREIFARARQSEPCIIFFDEIESVAPRRGNDANSAWDRVVAQLLTCMDGMDRRGKVSVMAATNRPDMIDPALLRPGRMDRLILVGRPDADARRRILGIHTRGMPLRDVDLDRLAAETEGYVGADLAALCREAGMAAYREDADAESVGMEHFIVALGNTGPSLDDISYTFYENIGRDLRGAGGRWDDLPSYR